jgi:hypothetical protein
MPSSSTSSVPTHLPDVRKNCLILLLQERQTCENLARRSGCPRFDHLYAKLRKNFVLKMVVFGNSMKQVMTFVETSDIFAAAV